MSVKIFYRQILHMLEHLFAHFGQRALGNYGHKLSEQHARKQAY